MVLAEKKGLGVKVFFAILIAAIQPASVLADSTVLIISGVPGSPTHAERFLAWTEDTRDIMVESFGFAPSDVHVLLHRNARKTNVRNAFANISGELGPRDIFFVFLIGHGSYDGSDYKFNILGPDLSASDYNDLLSSVGAGRTVIVNATNSSGGSIEKLAGQNRVIITATGSGMERNDTVFYGHFLAALKNVASDDDKNGKLSVWEAFRYASLAVERFYSEENRLATEHPQLSDNGRKWDIEDSESLPDLARIIYFNNQPEVEPSNPVIRALLEDKRKLEEQLESLRLVKDTMHAEQYDQFMEEVLVQLALINLKLREQELNQ